MKDFDVIVIGSGIGGLVSAGILASNGLRPLVLESHSTPGGYLSSFRRKGFIFDSAVDCISGVGPGGLIRRVLSSLGVLDGLDFVRLDPIRSSIFPSMTVDVDADIGAYTGRLTSLFPSESDGIRSFFEMARKIYGNVLSTVDVTAGGAREHIGMSSDLLKFRNMTYEDALSMHIDNRRLKSILSDRCPFLGVPPYRVAALPMIMLIMSYFMQGAYRTAGGFQRLSDRLADGIHQNGGSVIPGRRVKRILLDSSSCRGVLCGGGEEYSARHVISNADFTHTLRELLGERNADMAGNPPGEPGATTSFFIVYAGIRKEFRGSSSIGYFPTYDMSALFGPDAAFREDGTLGITVASVDDGLRAPAGCHTVVLHEMVEGEPVTPGREECSEIILKKAENIIPGLTDSIVVMETATPRTLERFTGNRNGAAFGWNQIPGSGIKRRHGIKNLHIAGHWSEMGGGVLAAAYSGAKAASEILSKEGITACV